MKPYIPGVIVVEGQHDSARLKKYFDCETIVTSGLGMEEKVLEEIRAAAARGPVIVFTDPDTPGEKIRRRIQEAVPSCMHAYVPKEDARTVRKVGVEHASFSALSRALSSIKQDSPGQKEEISAETMLELGLLGQENSSERRRKLASALHIAYGSASKMRKEMNRFGISEQTVREILNG